MHGMAAIGLSERAVAVGGEVLAEDEEVDGAEHWEASLRKLALEIIELGRERGMMTY
jgi:hypothetical protein